MFRRLVEPAGHVTVTIDGRPFSVAAGETLSTAMLLAGFAGLRRSARLGRERGPFCGMGVCFDCLVTIDGAANRQACLVRVRDGMAVQTGTRLAALADTVPE
ncbi:(2Fe-2S)-binding protein [Phreatobacter sp.]|jgi:predicted molibdopterin-dependent oxidoreductase YjgC|uniref:(2Fe-2S)-binding protein n=1 Tax=Phreatobacter sp. TaxID=1966341 RepID=UPI0025E1E700|nr:(2Fe-2S)-binding protein [Phreatobacter sp.]